MSEMIKQNGMEAGRDVAALERLMAERGFRVSRGKYHYEEGKLLPPWQYGDGEILPAWVIDRPDTPTWLGVFQPYEREPEFVEDGEVQTLLRLCSTAMTTWDEVAWMYFVENQHRKH